MIQEITQAAVEPLTKPIGWQAFAYGLLGLKSIKKTITTIKGFVGQNNDN